MSRKPTERGRGRGRPKGSGQLGEEGVGHVRLTIRLPRHLYDALEATAERAHYTKGSPDLARTVRTALEHYLACPQRWQTGIVPHTSLAHNRQTENSLETLDDYTRQTIIVPELLGDTSGQMERVPEPAPTTEAPRGTRGQTEQAETMAEDNTRQTGISPVVEPTPKTFRSPMRRRILTLLEEHPKGLDATELRVYLKVETPLGDTLQGMRKQGVVRTQGSGKETKYFRP
jgi:hypothetical protein